MATKHIRPQATVEFSDTATVNVKGSWYSPFERNSYSARVEFKDGRVRVVALPKNARMLAPSTLVDDVIAVADAAEADATVIE